MEGCFAVTRQTVDTLHLPPTVINTVNLLINFNLSQWQINNSCCCKTLNS